MLQSNEPYFRVDNGIREGLVGGMAVGGALTAAAYWGLPRLKQSRTALTTKTDLGNVNVSPDVLKQLTKEQMAQMGLDQMKEVKAPTFANRAHKFMFGSKGRAIGTVAAGILGMGLLGAAIDAAND